MHAMMGGAAILVDMTPAASVVPANVTVPAIDGKATSPAVPTIEVITVLTGRLMAVTAIGGKPKVFILRPLTKALNVVCMTSHYRMKSLDCSEIQLWQ